MPKRRDRKPMCIARGCRRLRLDGDTLCAWHRADRIVGDLVKLRDGCCVRCGVAGPLDWAHLHSRSYRAVRWDPLNSVALCRACHRWLDLHPIEKEDWAREHIGSAIYDELRRRALSHEKVDPAEVIASYEVLA